MNCDNCGAPMKLFHEGEYFFCEYCGAFQFPRQTDQGVRLLDERVEDLKCPTCHEPLTKAKIEFYPAYHCDKCRGILMNRYMFGEMVKYVRARAKGPADRPHPLNRGELKRQIACPSCGQPMETHPYYGPGNIAIDTCGPCDLIWLDYGELIKVVNAPGRDRAGEDGEIPLSVYID
jgi:Zn-finger nucleic acid-binding protein